MRNNVCMTYDLPLSKPSHRLISAGHWPQLSLAESLDSNCGHTTNQGLQKNGKIQLGVFKIVSLSQNDTAFGLWH